ncbi:MAG: hypothetical protein A2Y02_02510 [Omnitrophica bacterium GWA2_52_12]|nr:MAG: hypothetical protein A2Y02_02510 [Omnitrophica bacterium GWA2_52_12]
MATGFLYDPRFLEHATGTGHPECPERLTAILNHLQPLPWFSALKQFVPKPAREEWLQTIHSADYLQRARETCRSGSPLLDTPDVPISENSYDIAKLAAGGSLELADRLMAGDIQNGFALLRPPGHHAERDLAMGFCLFNNVAILARYLQQHHGLEKIAILDWDVHHGNGTQHSFEEDPSVFYISLHQFPFYPGTGRAAENGAGRGKGYTLNCPMRAGAGDWDYEQAFSLQILPALENYKPDAILISAGFDAHRVDPLGQINLSTEFYGWMTERVLEIAARHSRGRILSLLEGGYDLTALPLCVAKHLNMLMRRGNS